MTPQDRDPRFLAFLLVVGGALLLAANVGWLAWVDAWLWALLFLGGGAAFLLHWRATPEHWWALIPGAVLSGLGVVFLAGDAGGAAFLGVLAAGFAAVFLADPRRWWVVLPAGILLTLAVVAWLDVRAPGWDAGWVLFLGLATTFAILALLPEGRGRQRWATWPALGAALFAALLLLSPPLSGTLVPLLLVATGAYLLVRRGGGPEQPAPPAKEA